MENKRKLNKMRKSTSNAPMTTKKTRPILT